MIQNTLFVSSNTNIQIYQYKYQTATLSKCEHGNIFAKDISNKSQD
jgi:hypothetical protein